MKCIFATCLGICLSVASAVAETADATRGAAGAGKKSAFPSLKGASDEEVMTAVRAYRGRTALDTPREVRLPVGFWEMPPKEAALAFVKSNQTSEQARQWELFLPEEEGVRAPETGWMTCDWVNRGCFHYSSACRALRFGVREPWILATGDSGGMDVRVVPVPREEARFLADVTFWLGRIRGKEKIKMGVESMYGVIGDYNETAVTWWEDGKPPVVATSGEIAFYPDGWRSRQHAGAMTRSLINWLWVKAVPVRMRERWGAPNRGTQELQRVIDEVLERRKGEAIPADALRDVILCMGEKRFTRYREIVEAMRKEPRSPTDGSEGLIDALKQTIGRFAMIAHPETLAGKEREGESVRDSRWRTETLLTEFPEQYEKWWTGQFMRGGPDQRREAFLNLRENLPEAARKLIANLDSDEQESLLTEIADLELSHDPAAAAKRIPALMKLAGTPGAGGLRRVAAMEALGKMRLSDEDSRKVDALLLAEIASNEEDGGRRIADEAVEVLSRMPNAVAHLERLGQGTSARFLVTLDALCRATAGRPDRRVRLERFVLMHFQKRSDEGPDILDAVLAHDLRGLTPAIEALAVAGSADAAAVLALWAEPDAETRARMWTARWLTSDITEGFWRTDSPTYNALSARAREAILIVPGKQRRTMIAGMREAVPRYLPSGRDAWFEAVAWE